VENYQYKFDEAAIATFNLLYNSLIEKTQKFTRFFYEKSKS